MNSLRMAIALAFTLTIGVGCGDGRREGQGESSARLAKYATVRLTADLSSLTPAQREMIPELIEAARQMDAIFWKQAYDGDPEALLEKVEDPATRKYIEINYGPWDRLEGDEPFVEGVGAKPAGANFYPADMTVAEFEAAVEESPDLRSLYTLVRRGEGGTLRPIPYREAYAEQAEATARSLRAAAELAEDPGLRRYLQLRAEALLTDQYRASDLAWLEMKDNVIDIVIGPIETYEDQLLGYKAAHEAYVLVKDIQWSQRLQRFAALLPDLQRGLPVPERYKQEMPGTDAELNAYDLIFAAGDGNAGSKSIAINLPNDEVVQLQKGTRRLQLKNAMRAKFDEILLPIANELIAANQRQHISFDAFFANTMFHEVAHGLGIKNTITGRGTVRQALRDHASAIEEGKADILGLYMVTRLYGDGELTEGDVRDNYVTFMSSIFRSVRFGASSAHGKANMVRFNFFKDMGAFTRDDATGTYSVDFDKMRDAMTALSQVILTLQGDGDYEAAAQLIRDKGVIGPGLQADLDRLSDLGIPVDIVFEQGMEVLEGA